jgi:protein-L-isoaspartate(D-aspartate) O-methyltransferase
MKNLVGVILLAILLGLCGCEKKSSSNTTSTPIASKGKSMSPTDSPTQAFSEQEADTQYVSLRKAMVDYQIMARGIKDYKVESAMRKVPRHFFVPPDQKPFAYEDNALPIAHGQTISQPYVVAFMTEALMLKGDEKVLEIGTGSGYQAAVLAEIVAQVYTIEIVDPLAKNAKAVLEKLGYKNIYVKSGDGYQGWPEYAPFDAIIVTCAPDHIPEPLQKQLKVGGRMIIPVGDTGWSGQDLVYLEKVSEDRIVQKKVLPVRFVPMTGEAEKK